MIRRHPAVLALAVGASILLAACAGGTAGPLLPDAQAVITAALKSSEAAKSVHVEVLIDGKAAVALPIGGASGPLDLTGTTISGDIDMAAPAAHLTFAVPGVLNLAGELIAVDGETYLKTTITGARYRVVDLGDTLPLDPTNPSGLIDNLGDFLLKPGVDPVKAEDVACGSRQCYTVTVDLDAKELAALTGAGPKDLPVDVAGASLQMTIRVEKDLPYHLAGLSARLTMGDGSVIKIEMTFSKWNETVSIKAPPADQVAPSS